MDTSRGWKVVVMSPTLPRVGLGYDGSSSLVRCLCEDGGSMNRRNALKPTRDTTTSAANPRRLRDCYRDTKALSEEERQLMSGFGTSPRLLRYMRILRGETSTDSSAGWTNQTIVHPPNTRFCRAHARDIEAVVAAVKMSWINGRVEAYQSAQDAETANVRSSRNRTP